MTEPEILSTIATTTGPVGTVMAIGFMWVRAAIQRQTASIEALITAMHEARHERADIDRRVRDLERGAGVPRYNHLEPTPVEGVLR